MSESGTNPGGVTTSDPNAVQRLIASQESLALKLDTVSNRLSELVSSFRASQARRALREINLVIEADATHPVDLGMEAGGAIIVPQNGLDLENVSIQIGPIKITFAANTTTPQFIPAPGVQQSLAVTNTSSSAISLRVIALDPHTAMMWAVTFGGKVA